MTPPQMHTLYSSPPLSTATFHLVHSSGISVSFPPLGLVPYLPSSATTFLIGPKAQDIVGSKQMLMRKQAYCPL